MAFQTDTRLTRQKQINTLKVYNELVESVVEGVEYRQAAIRIITCVLQDQVPRP